jgi:hypothetical protein
MRSMVEGARRIAAPTRGPLHHAASRRGPPPRSGEDLEKTQSSGAIVTLRPSSSSVIRIWQDRRLPASL